MPCYSFHHPEDESLTADIVMSMDDPHEIFDENGNQWIRVWNKPNATIDGKPIDPYSEQQFVDRTAKKKGTLGNLWDYSAELSEKRASKDGFDAKKQSYYRKQRKNRGGKPSFAEVKEQAKKASESTFIIG